MGRLSAVRKVCEMPRQETILSVFLASPSDVSAERTRLEEVIAELNQSWSRTLGVRLDLIRWETHAYPGFGDDAQDVINEQIPLDYDIFIGILWSRFGTPTGRAGSGTQEEYLRAKEKWDRDRASINIMFYFKDSPLAPSQIDGSQLAKVSGFRQSLADAGSLYSTYSGSEDDFANLVRIHLTRVIQAWQTKLNHRAESQALSQGSGVPLIAAQTKSVDEDDLGFLDLVEEIVEDFNDAAAVLARIAKATESVGKKVQEQNKRIEASKAAGQLTPSVAKRMVGKASKNMKDFAAKLDTDVPALDKLMTSGLGSVSRAVALVPEFVLSQDDQQQLGVMITSIVQLRGVLVEVEAFVEEFRSGVTSMPRLSTDLNRAKRALSAALQQMIDLLQRHQQNLEQTEKAAREVLDALGGVQYPSSLYAGLQANQTIQQREGTSPPPLTLGEN
jgi:uncharacterized protein YukE